MEKEQSADRSLTENVCASSFTPDTPVYQGGQGGKRRGFRIAAGAGLAALLLGALLAGSLFMPAFDLTETAYVHLRPGESEEDVMEHLQTEAHATRVAPWRLLSSALGFKLRPGRYAVHPGESMATVFRRLRSGSQEPVRLTIPSVRTMQALAGFLAQKLMLDSAATANAFSDSTFTASYAYTTATLPALFIPNTYELYWDTSLESFMQRMVRENDAFWSAQGRAEAAKAAGLTPTEVITLASIVEEETANNAEKPDVAGMYINRLREGMPLQADPTVKFALGDPTLRRILRGHLTTPSPYNTYIHEGLPPGPIRIPSVASIEAVLHFRHHDFLYMCAKEDFSGTHNFARTFAEHQANARRYQQALNQRGIK